ncbi:hypothetical protein REPUB_Repub18cG0067900 [Reevesia pubescens]
MWKEVETSLSKTNEIFKREKDSIVVTSSPKFGVHKIYFGWGGPRKTEFANIFSEGSLSMFAMADSREEEGGVEFGLAFAPREL